jgi:hypothetical protein
VTRRTAWAGVALSVVLGAGLAGCSGDDEPTASSTSASTGADDCSGGDVSVLQGQPADLPDGGQVGIGDGTPTGDTTYAAGDTFDVGSVSYRVDCVAAGKVTLSSVDG